MWYYPCIANKYGRILKKVSNRAMPKHEAENFLKWNFYRFWRNCEAIPQPANTAGLHD